MEYLANQPIAILLPALTIKQWLANPICPMKQVSDLLSQYWGYFEAGERNSNRFGRLKTNQQWVTASSVVK
nr:hypothetical protein HmN_000203900 [Hymenolepis microstoma]